MCDARAVAEYAYGYRDPETPKMREGTRLHRIVQAYLRDGTIPEPHELAARKLIDIIPFGPASISSHNIERVLRLPEWFGFIDFESDDHDIEGDLKFTSALKYLLEVDPNTDPQRIVYALDAFHRDPRRKIVTQLWCVGQFDGQAARVLRHEWTRATAEKAYNDIIAPRAEAFAGYLEDSTLHWQDAPKNTRACTKYPPKGCPVAHICRRSLKQTLLQLKPKAVA